MFFFPSLLICPLRQKSVRVCRWMRACTWRTPCQSWERAVHGSQTDGFSPLLAAGAPLTPGWVLSGPTCLFGGVFFCLRGVPVSVPASQGVTCVSTSTHLHVCPSPLYMQISLVPYKFLRACCVHTICLFPHVSYKDACFYAPWEWS